MGLREHKKLQTRQLIADTAWQLFADQGFDRVTVTQVARRANVSPATVFNYFARKEDLFYWGLDTFGERLVQAVANRDDDESALAAVRRFLFDSGGLLSDDLAADAEALERLRTLNRVIAESPALQAREQQSIAGYTQALANLLADEMGLAADDVRAWVAANAIIGVQRALIDVVRRRVLHDDRISELADDTRRLAIDALALLEQGLGGYAVRVESPSAAGQTSRSASSRNASGTLLDDRAAGR